MRRGETSSFARAVAPPAVPSKEGAFERTEKQRNTIPSTLGTQVDQEGVMKVFTSGAKRRRRKYPQREQHLPGRCMASCSKQHHSTNATLVVLLTLLALVGSQDQEGDWCVSDEGYDGFCRHLRHCPYLQSKADVFNGGGPTTPDLCSYGTSGPVVCCPTVTPKPTPAGPRPQTPAPTQKPRPAAAVPRPQPTAPRQPKPKPSKINTVGLRMSDRKCVEYMNSLDQEATELRSSLSDVWCPYPPPGNELIVGGAEANSGEYPHMAAMGYLKRGQVNWLCGGSLISRTYVLTAAHCLRRDLGSLIAVSLGALRVSNMSVVTVKRLMEGAGETSHVYPIAESLRHPLYSSFSYYDDIALLRLAVPVRTFDLYVRPACLHSDTSIDGIQKAVACGFGHTEFQDESTTRLLKHVTLSVYSPDVCKQVFSAVTQTSKLSKGIIETQMCAGHLAGGRDTCSGDSGGPLQTRDKDDKCIIRIIGVTSFGTALCGIKNSAAIYTSVAHYLPWIESVVWPP